jgi:hypothetical protein
MSNKWLHQRKRTRGDFKLRNGTIIPGVEVARDRHEINVFIEHTPMRHDHAFDWSMDVGADDAIIDGIEATPTIRGSDLLELGIELAQEFKAKRVGLDDGSMIELTKDIPVSLSWLHIFMDGKTWYQSKGFVPDIPDYNGYLREVSILRSTPMLFMLWTVLPRMEWSVTQFLRSIPKRDNVILILDTMFLTNPAFGERFQDLLIKSLRPKKKLVYKKRPIALTNDWLTERQEGVFSSNEGGSFKLRQVGKTYTVLNDDDQVLMEIRYWAGEAAVVRLANEGKGRNKAQLLQLAEEIMMTYEPVEYMVLAHGVSDHWTVLLANGLRWYNMMGYVPEGFSLEECHHLLQMANEIKLGNLYSFPEVFEGDVLAEYMLQLWREDRFLYAQIFDLLFKSGTFPWSETFENLDTVIRDYRHFKTLKNVQ